MSKRLSKDHRRKIGEGVKKAALSKKIKPTEQTFEPISAAIQRDVSRNEYVGLTGNTVASVLSSTETGKLIDWMELAEKIQESDEHIRNLISTRKNAISARDIKIVPASSEIKDIQIAELVDEMIKSIEDLPRAITTLQDGIFTGLGAVEIMWEIKKYPNGVILYEPTGLEPIPSKRFEVAQIENKWKYILSDYGVYLPDLKNPLIKNPEKFIIHSPDSINLPHRRGLLRSLAFHFFFKKLCLNYWMGGAEKHGFPAIYALVPPNTRPDVLNKYVASLYNMSNDAVGVFENTVKIETLDSKAGEGNQIYKDLYGVLEAAASKLILGGSLAVDSSVNGANRSLAEVHERTKLEIIDADAQALSQTIKFQLVKPILALNKHLFGGKMPSLPEVKFEIKDKTFKQISQLEVQASAVTINEMRKAVNLPPVAWGDVRAQFGGVVPQEPETIKEEQISEQEIIEES